MLVETFCLGPLQTNSFLIEQGGAAVAVDCGGDPEPVLERLMAQGLALTHILLTHLHFDHIYGVRTLAKATGAIVLAGEEDKPLLRTDVGRGGFMGFPEVPSFTFTPVAQGEISVLAQPCLVLATPGHTPGSRAYYFPEAGAVFSGDVLFNRSIGRTDFPLSDHETLLHSVREKIFALPRDTVVYPGHGPATTVGDEHDHNPFFMIF